MIELDAATVLLQWSAGGMVFCWVTTRHRTVSLGYGWLLRGTYLSLAVLALVAGRRWDPSTVRDAGIAAFAVAVAVALVVSVARRSAGVSGRRADHDRRTARVAAMTGIERSITAGPDDATRPGGSDGPGRLEFPPVLDLVAAGIGMSFVAVAAIDTAEPALALVRLVVGALFLGAVTDAMLLGHWYLVQPGLQRGPLLELVRWTGCVWPFEVAALLVPTGMVSVLDGTIVDGYNGMLGWFWVACAISTIVLVVVTRAALRERAYSAVMAATGLLYLAILTAFGTDLVARAVLA